MRAPAKSRSKGRNSALRGTWRGQCPLGPDGGLRWSPPGQGEGTLAGAQARKRQQTLQRVSLQKSQEDIISQRPFSLPVLLSLI